MKKYLITSIISFSLYLGVAALRGGYVALLGLEGIYLSAFIGYFVFAITTLTILKKYNSRSDSVKIVIAIVLGTSILEIPLRLFDFSNSLFTLGTLLSCWFSIITAYLIYRIKIKKIKILISILSIATIIWFSFSGYSLWVHKINHGTFKGITEQIIETPIVFQDSTGLNIPLNDFSGKYLVLDFWVSSCGVCFKKFPQVQNIYNDLKTADNIKLYSVFCSSSKRGETHQNGVDMLQQRGYTFPTLSLDGDNPILKEIGVDAYPTVIIFDPNGKLIFRGDIESAEQLINKFTTR